MTTRIETHPKKEERIAEKDPGIVPAPSGPKTVDTADQKSTPPAFLSQVQHGPRLKTYGEKKFNLLTYGGFALLGNEASSLIITKLVEDENKNPRGLYAPFKKFFTGLKGKRFVPEYVWNGGLPGVLVALIGGMLMVPFVKHMEDHKGEKVRNYDRKHYGNERIETDPAIVAAHKEMDDAPKQSWGSLWKGRIVTVFSAIAVDGLMGWKDAPSTKLVAKITKPDSFWNKYSSMDRIATQVSEKTLKLFNATPQSHKKADTWIQKGAWLLVLSSTLTLLFYASSKLFARKRDEKLERQDYFKTHPEMRDEIADSAPEASAPAAKPEARITQATYEQKLGSSATVAPTM